MAGSDFLQLDPADAGRQPVTEWLTQAIRAATGDGRLPPGIRLPSTRILAADLGVSRGVVVEAYQRLLDEGRIVTHGAGGTFVADNHFPVADAPAAAAPEPPSPDVIDLTPGAPDLSAFPRTGWLRAERAALTTTAGADLGYGDPRGANRLRCALADWLARGRGLTADPDDIVIVGGVAQALSLLGRVLTASGRARVAVEDPGSFGTARQLARQGMRLLPVPVDNEGLDVTALGEVGADAVLVTPAHQFPTGAVLAPTRRRTLLEWAASGRLIIEDDYDAEHRYDRPPVAALHALAPQHVAYTGSVSKTLAPALRLGWLIPPPALHDEIVEAKVAADLASPILPQLVLAQLLGGEFERHLRRVRIRQRARRDAMLAALARQLPGAEVHGVAAGLHLTITFDDEIDDGCLTSAARERGVRVHPLSLHRHRPGPPGLVLGYAAETPDRIQTGIQRIADAARHTARAATR